MHAIAVSKKNQPKARRGRRPWAGLPDWDCSAATFDKNPLYIFIWFYNFEQFCGCVLAVTVSVECLVVIAAGGLGDPALMPKR